MKFTSEAPRTGRIRLTIELEPDEVRACGPDQRTVMRALCGLHPEVVERLFKQLVRAELKARRERKAA